MATHIEDHFASAVAVRFCCDFGKCGCCRRQCPCHGVHASCEHVGEPYAVVSILCEPIDMHEHVIFSYAYFSYEVRSDSRQETREQRQTTDQTRDHTREQTRDRDERGDLDERQTRPKTRPNTREEVTGPFRICICGGNLAGARTTFVILIFC